MNKFFTISEPKIALKVFFWTPAEAKAWVASKTMPGNICPTNSGLACSGYFWQIDTIHACPPCHGPFRTEAEAMADILEREEVYAEELAAFCSKPPSVPSHPAPDRSGTTTLAGLTIEWQAWMAPAEPDVGLASAYVEDFAAQVVALGGGEDICLHIEAAEIGVRKCLPCQTCAGNGKVALLNPQPGMAFRQCPHCGGRGHVWGWQSLADHITTLAEEAE